MKRRTGYRWFVFAVYFVFMLLHQSDRLLIGPLTTPIMETFGIDEVQMGAIFTGALLVSAILFPLWGYLFDRYSRARLLALASAIWGSTAWLSAIAPTYPTFLVTRASGLSAIMAALGGAIYIVVVVASVFFGRRIEGKIELGAPTGVPAATTYGSSESLRIPGTLILVGVFFVAFVLYYFVNWKYLSTVWGLS